MLLFLLYNQKLALTGVPRRFVVARAALSSVGDGDIRPSPAGTSSICTENVDGHTTRSARHTASNSTHFQVCDWNIIFGGSSRRPAFVVFLNVDSVFLDTYNERRNDYLSWQMY